MEGINLQVELNPRSVRKVIRSQRYEECLSNDDNDYDAKNYVSNTQEHEEELIARELQATTITGTILGI